VCVIPKHTPGGGFCKVRLGNGLCPSRTGHLRIGSTFTTEGAENTEKDETLSVFHPLRLYGLKYYQPGTRMFCHSPGMASKRTQS
jgi:hypothetical protein